MFDNFLKRQSDVFYIQVWRERIKVTELNSSEVFDDEPSLAYKSDGDKKTIMSIGVSSSDYEGQTDHSIVRPFYSDGHVVGDADSSAAIINHAIHTITQKLSGKFFSPLLIFHAMEDVNNDGEQSDEALKKMLSRRCGAKNVLIMRSDDYLDLDDFR